MKTFEYSIEEIHATLVSSLREFFAKSGQKKAVLGLSGGIDSAVVAALAVEALGKENVCGILMPSQFSTLHSLTDAVDLANNLDMKHIVIPIEKMYHRAIKDLAPIFDGDNSWDNTQENIQARIRGMIVMAYSNRHGALALNTSNKSELAMGYGTLYGDLAGAVMVIADIYKIQVYDLARYINRERTIIPISTITKAPSAELRHDQKDTDSLPEYALLDPVLHALIEEGKSKEELLEEGVEEALIDRILTLKARSAFKVHQMAPVIKVSDKPIHYPEKWV
ncbi:MAG: NAD(+) synthase [Bacteroidales bacterium]|jgi:NAD+ synthase (glutamine-hydrolysing)|nr:NAD(+) synthase [Bacteroidales bacterium]MBO7763694.1 NAD(+) synthase [Bacteroidales bacterium]MBQ2243855.1 NAD(+) synthase [Bacteroidales bacterium]